MTHLFTYGTLMTGHSRNDVLKDQTCVGNFYTEPEFRLFEYESFAETFPCMILSKDDGYPVFGEVYEITSNHYKLWQHLDRIEGVPFFYKREAVKVCDINGNYIEATTYLYQESVAPLKETKLCWPKDEIFKWYGTGKCLSHSDEGFQLLASDEKKLSETFEDFNSLCEWCAENITAFGNCKLSANEWNSALNPLRECQHEKSK